MKIASGGDHGGIVGAQGGAGTEDGGGGAKSHRFTEQVVGSNATGEQDALHLVPSGSLHCLGHQDIDRCLLKAGSDIGEQRAIYSP